MIIQRALTLFSRLWLRYDHGFALFVIPLGISARAEILRFSLNECICFFRIDGMKTKTKAFMTTYRNYTLFLYSVLGIIVKNVNVYIARTKSSCKRI